jgi:hypothetical protein
MKVAELLPRPRVVHYDARVVMKESSCPSCSGDSMIRRLEGHDPGPWGDDTPQTRASVQSDGRIRLLTLDRFRRGLTTWL